MTGSPSDTELPAGVPWYAEGIRFQCTACGKCCENHGGEYEYVWSTRKERQALATHFGLSLRRFEAEYTERVDGRVSFRSQNAACVFLEDGRCSVYEFRPRQCRTFPFWPELLEDKSVWKHDVADFCPGVGNGTLHDIAAIRATMKKAGW